MTGTVLIVAKAAVVGRSKTRLVPPLSAAQAASLQTALLLDTLESCRAEGVEVGLLCATPGDRVGLAAVVGRDVRLFEQEGRGLADALRLAIRRFTAEGPVAIVSSDIPGVPPGSLAAAFKALRDGADVVLGPALDGGYWTIAMREPHPAPFLEIPWSTPAACAVTVSRCRDAGLRVEMLEPVRDVDTVVDLAFLLEDLDRLRAPRTRAVLLRLAEEATVAGAPTVRLVDSELVLGSRWRALVRDRLATADGRSLDYSYLAVPRAAFVVPVTDEGEVVLVRQYRHPVRDFTLEVPAGSVEDGESALEAAVRELAEEVGGHARELSHLSTFYSSSAHLSLRSDAFLALGVRLAVARPEDGEELAIVRMPVAEALARARSGGFVEGQTALALLLAAPLLEGRASADDAARPGGR